APSFPWPFPESHAWPTPRRTAEAKEERTREPVPQGRLPIDPNGLTMETTMGRKLPALCVRVKWDTAPRGRPCVNAEECRADRCQETLRKRGRRPVLPNMETLHPSRSARPVTVVAVAAPIARSAIDPVRTHPPSAHPAYQQPSAQILSDPP